MATHVYANGLEVASKSSDGVASTAFPDPCWSPPPPSAGPIVIPYSNTAFPRDITNGTRTVFVAGKEVALEDKSYFSTSTGNEPATYAFGKGVATGVIKGRAYFRSWSMDVKFEGLGVDRHTDRISHNHGSMPGNTPTFPFLSRGAAGESSCGDEKGKIDKECEPDEGKTWREKYCDGLDTPLSTYSAGWKYLKKKDMPEDAPEEDKKATLKAAANEQSKKAKANRCVKARKCQLVSYKESSSEGCCSGQTGHHLIYDAMMREKKPKNSPKGFVSPPLSGCGKYEHGSAPTVCVEGINQHLGSHGRVHDKMDKQVKDNHAKIRPDGTMSMDDAIQMAADSHQKAFPSSKCSRACIVAQLEGYYKNKEKLDPQCSKVRAVDKLGKNVNPDVNMSE